MDFTQLVWAEEIRVGVRDCVKGFTGWLTHMKVISWPAELIIAKNIILLVQARSERDVIIRLAFLSNTWEGLEFQFSIDFISNPNMSRFCSAFNKLSLESCYSCSYEWSCQRYGAKYNCWKLTLSSGNKNCQHNWRWLTVLTGLAFRVTSM